MAVNQHSQRSFWDHRRQAAVGRRKCGTIHHSNDGEHWNAPISASPNDLYGIFGTSDGNRLWTAGDKGTILESDDAGQTGKNLTAALRINSGPLRDAGWQAAVGSRRRRHNRRIGRGGNWKQLEVTVNGNAFKGTIYWIFGTRTANSCGLPATRARSLKPVTANTGPGGSRRSNQQ